MIENKKPERLLWNDRVVVAFFATALLVTIAVIAFQMTVRRGILFERSVSIFYRLFFFEDYPASFIVIVALGLALAPPVQRAGAALARRLGRNVGATAVLTAVLLSVGAVTAYRAYPLSMDEYAAYLQSRIFASGALVGRYPPELMNWLIYTGFQDYFIRVWHVSGQIASSYWPGFAMLLTPFTAAGVPWLCNPILGALSVVVIYRLTLNLTESAEASGTAVLFALASAAFVVNAISFYSMTAHLLCNAVFALLLLTPTPARAALAGLVGGLALTLHNPVPHMMFAAPWLIWLLTLKDRWRLSAAIAAGYLPWIVVVGFGWAHLPQYLSPQVAAGMPGGGAGALAGAAETFMSVFTWPTEAMLEARVISAAKLWLWAAPAMILLAGVGLWRNRFDRRFQLLFASAALTFVGYIFVPPSQGHGWGYRYFHSAWFVLPIFAAAALLPHAKSRDGAENGAGLLCRYAQGAALGGLLLLMPYYLWVVHSFISTHLEQLPSADHGRPRIVLINPVVGYYARDLVHNDPFLRDPVIMMLTNGHAADEQMIAGHFPGLVRLSRDYRGDVWGLPDAAVGESGTVPVVGDEHRQQE